MTMVRFRDLNVGDEFKFGPTGLVWTVFHVGSTVRRQPIICYKNDNGTHRVAGPINTVYKRKVELIKMVSSE